jgi:signal peptidase II
MADLRLKAYGAAAAVFALDQATKRFIDHYVSDFATYRVIPGFFDIIRSENRGVAFGLFNDSTSEWRTLALVVASLVAVILISIMLWRPERMERLSLAGLALILGGAAGNLFDRLVWGHVTDFLLFYIGSYQWPTFNAADSAIVIGGALLVIDLLRAKRQAVNVS